MKNTEVLSHRLPYIRMIILFSLVLAIPAKSPTPIAHSADLAPMSPTGLPLTSSTFLGGPGDQRGTGITIASAIFVSGSTDANQGDALVASYALPLTNGASPVWSKTWPTLGSYDDFTGIGVSSEGVYLSGQSFNRTTDTVGGKEGKGITVKFPLTGPPGGGFDGSIWDVQSPAPPGAFPYGGGEGLNAATVAIEGGLPFVYVTGNSQSSGINGCRLYVSKLNSAGTVLWTQTDAAATPCSQGLAITTLNGNVYVAGHNDDSGTQVYLVKYAAAGGPATWTRKSITFNGSYFGITAFGGAIYAFGYNQSGVGGSFDFLIEKWDEAGTLQWSRQYDRGSSEDVLYGGVGLGSRIYAVGSSTGASAGGRDIALIELDPANGDLKSTTLFGGAMDDIARGAATDGTSIYVVGESKSFASAAGNVIGQNDLVLLSFGAGPTAAPAAITGTVTMADGAPLAGVSMRLSGAVSATAITDSNGRYRFNNVAAGEFYSVTPGLVNYHFSPSNRSFSQVGNNTEAVFTASFNGDVDNPLDTPEYFVRQQYVDVLGREPDEGGFNYWSSQILACGADALCVNTRRTGVASAFFIENEFRQSGAFIYNLYKSALGRRPVYAEYAADRRNVVGGATLEAQKQAFAEAFVARSEFASRYEGNTNAASFVDALLANVQAASGVELSSQRGSLIESYHSGTSQADSRALVLLAVTESAAVGAANYNGAFVAVEYFGYLHRGPDQEGYDFWLNVLNTGDAGNYRGMVCSFITSAEYQRRFSAVVSHSNSECGSQ